MCAYVCVVWVGCVGECVCMEHQEAPGCVSVLRVYVSMVCMKNLRYTEQQGTPYGTVCMYGMALER